MLRDLKDRVLLFRKEHPEQFDRRVNRMIGVFTVVMMIVASVNIMSVMTIFQPLFQA